MRTNRACPQYQLNAPPPPVNVALTQEQENEIHKQINDEVEDLVNVDGTKVKISGKLFKVRMPFVCSFIRFLLDFNVDTFGFFLARRRYKTKIVIIKSTQRRVESQKT